MFERYESHALLTAGERRVLIALLDHDDIRSVADLLGVADSTPREHIKRLHQKTDTHALHTLAVWAYRHLDCCVVV